MKIEKGNSKSFFLQKSNIPISQKHETEVDYPRSLSLAKTD